MYHKWYKVNDPFPGQTNPNQAHEIKSAHCASIPARIFRTASLPFDLFTNDNRRDPTRGQIVD